MIIGHSPAFLTFRSDLGFDLHYVLSTVTYELCIFSVFAQEQYFHSQCFFSPAKPPDGLLVIACEKETECVRYRDSKLMILHPFAGTKEAMDDQRSQRLIMCHVCHSIHTFMCVHTFINGTVHVLLLQN